MRSKLLPVAAALSLLLAVGRSANADSPYATELISSTGLTGSSLYNDPYAVLGAPTTYFWNQGFMGTGTGAHRVKLVEPAYNVAPDGSKLITTLNVGQSVTVKFDHQVMDDPLNPYGLDFMVFGNSFFVGSGTVSDATNMNTYRLTGGGFYEPMLISVSQDGANWYTYNSGPYGDALFPTNAFLWDSADAAWTDVQSDFTKPVNPALTDADFKGLTAAQAIALYDGSGGGAGFDLGESGYDWIQYIRVTGVSGYSGGEIDAFADVSPLSKSGSVPEPSSAAVLGSLITAVGVCRRVWRRR